MKKILIIAMIGILIGITGGYFIGYNAAIKQAVPEKTENGYIITFGNNTHEYR